MAPLLVTGGIALALLAIPAFVRSWRFEGSGNSKRAAREAVRGLVALLGAIALFFIAMGRSA